MSPIKRLDFNFRDTIDSNKFEDPDTQINSIQKEIENLNKGLKLPELTKLQAICEQSAQNGVNNA